MYAFDNGLREMKPTAGHGNISNPKTRRNAETDAFSKSAMADEGENCGTSSCIFWNTLTYKASVLRDIKAKKIGKAESAYGTNTVSSW